MFYRLLKSFSSGVSSLPRKNISRLSIGDLYDLIHECSINRFKFLLMRRCIPFMWIHARVKSGRDYHATALPVVNTEGCGILVLVSFINILWLERQWGAIGVVFYPFSLHFCFTCIQAKVTKPFPELCQVPGPGYCHSVFHILTIILKLLIFL